METSEPEAFHLQEALSSKIEECLSLVRSLMSDTERQSAPATDAIRKRHLQDSDKDGSSSAASSCSMCSGAAGNDDGGGCGGGSSDSRSEAASASLSPSEAGTACGSGDHARHLPRQHARSLGVAACLSGGSGVCGGRGEGRWQPVEEWQSRYLGDCSDCSLSVQGAPSRPRTRAPPRRRHVAPASSKASAAATLAQLAARSSSDSFPDARSVASTALGASPSSAVELQEGRRREGWGVAAAAARPSASASPLQSPPPPRRPRQSLRSEPIAPRQTGDAEQVAPPAEVASKCSDQWAMVAQPAAGNRFWESPKVSRSGTASLAHLDAPDGVGADCWVIGEGMRRAPTRPFRKMQPLPAKAYVRPPPPPPPPATHPRASSSHRGSARVTSSAGFHSQAWARMRKTRPTSMATLHKIYSKPFPEVPRSKFRLFCNPVPWQS